MTEGAIEVAPKGEKIRYGPVRNWGSGRSKIIYGTRQYRLNEVTNWTVVSHALEGAFAEALRRSQEMDDDEILQQRVLEAEEGDTFDVNFALEDAQDEVFLEELGTALSQGFAVEEFFDEALARTTVEVTEEEVIKVFHGTNGSSTRVATPSKRVTRAAAAIERQRLAAIREAQIEEDNGIRDELMRDDQDGEPGLALRQVTEEFKVEGLNPEMEVEPAVPLPNAESPIPPPMPSKEGQGLEGSQHADKKLTREQLEALCPRLDTDSETDSDEERDGNSTTSESMESRCSDIITTGLGLIEWAKVADLIEKAFEIINASRPAFWDEGNDMEGGTKRKMVNLAVALGHLVEDRWTEYGTWNEAQEFHEEDGDSTVRRRLRTVKDQWMEAQRVQRIMRTHDLESKVDKLGGAVARVAGKLQVGSVEENREALEAMKQLEKERIEEEKKRRSDKDAEEANRRHREVLKKQEEEKEEAAKIERIQKQKLELKEERRKNNDAILKVQVEIARKAEEQGNVEELAQAHAKMAEVLAVKAELAKEDNDQKETKWLVVKNGRTYKKVQVVTLMKGSYQIAIDKKIEYANKTNELLQQGSADLKFNTWRVREIQVRAREGDMYEIAWTLEGVEVNTTAEDAASRFFQYAAGALVGSTTIRCYPFIADVGVIVIKGVPKSAGVGEELYNAIKSENPDRKSFWGYSFPHRFAGSVKSPNTNVKLEVRSWKYAGDLLKGGLVVGGLRRTVELYQAGRHNGQQQQQHPPQTQSQSIQKTQTQTQGAWKNGRPGSTPPVTGSNTTPVNQRRGAHNTTPRSIVKCFNCGGLGHVKKYCNEGNKANARKLGCYNCEGVGHIESECNAPKKNKPYCPKCNGTTHYLDQCTSRRSWGGQSSQNRHSSPW